MECEFCKELKGDESYFSNLYRKYIKSRVIIETPNFVVIPSIGQIVEGYLLIVSREHYTSVGALSTEKIQELEEVMRRIKKLFISIYDKKPIFFEHGVPCDDENRGGCGIYHLHVHAVPLENQMNLLKRISEDFSFKRIWSILELRDIISRNKSYLLYVNQKGEMWVAENDYFPSQYMRRILAKAIGEKVWDWRKFEREERLILTYHKLAKITSQLRL